MYIKGLLILLTLSISLMSNAQQRYSHAEIQSLNDTLRSLKGKQKKCAVNFIKGYEFYAYPHCVEYNGNMSVCKNYKGKVPHSVIDTAFHICSVNWQSELN